MKDEKKVGRKKGVLINQNEFDDLMAALGKTRKEVGEMFEKPITPQGVSSWRQERSIPLGHLLRIGSHLASQLQTRLMTDVDRRAMEFLKRANVISILDASGSASSLSQPMPLPNERLKSDFSALKELSPNLNALTASIGNLSAVADDILIRELESRGFVVGTKINRKKELEG